VQTADYEAVLSFLGRSPYAPYVDLDATHGNPRRTVYQIRRHLADVYAKLIRTSPSPGSGVLERLWHHYEVDNVRVALRGAEVDAPWTQVLYLLYPMEKYISVTLEDLEAMVRAGSVENAIEVLRGSTYYAPLSHAITRYIEEHNLFPLEVALDLGYRRALWGDIMELPGKDREMAFKTTGTVLDSDNLLWAIRYRVYHRLSEAEIINYTLPLGYEVHDSHIRAIARGSDIAEVVFDAYPQLEQELAGVSFESGAGLEALELALLHLQIGRCRSMFVGSPFHLGLPLAYVWLSEYEIRDLTVIIEAKATGLRPERFVSRLAVRGA
jgi:vacuolar-type H+-ATPase subunit C/Vma6